MKSKVISQTYSSDGLIKSLAGHIQTSLVWFTGLEMMLISTVDSSDIVNTPFWFHVLLVTYLTAQF